MLLSCNLFWKLSLPVLSEHFTCWDELLGDFLVASGVSLCFSNVMKSNPQPLFGQADIVIMFGL